MAGVSGTRGHAGRFVSRLLGSEPASAGGNPPGVLPWSPRALEAAEQSAAELTPEPIEPMEAPLCGRETPVETPQEPEQDENSSSSWQQQIAEGKAREAEGDWLGAALAYFAALSEISEMKEDREAEAYSELSERLAALCEEHRWGPSRELAALPQRQRETALQAMEHSQQYLAQGLLRAAVEECYIAIGAAPDYLPVQLRLADIYERQGETSSAAEKRGYVVQVYRLRGEPRRAMEICEQRLAAAADEEQAGLLETMREIRQATPDDERLRTVLAQAYFRLGQMERAVEEFAELTALHESRGEYAEALPLYHAMLQLTPDDVDLRERLCKAYLHAGLDAEASDELETLADERLRRGLVEQAANSLRLALERCRREDQRRALRLREKLVKLVPHDAQLRRELIAAYLKTGRASQALAEARSWAESSLQAGTPEEVQQALSQVLQLDPWNAEARRRLQELASSDE